jgi:putative peptidoglycan lipid II flippase
VTDSTDRLKQGRIGRAALIVGAGILISRLLGMLREVVFAAALGANADTDTYVAAFRIPDYANYLLAGGFLTITFIPIFSKYLADDDEREGWRAFTAIIRWLAIGIVVLIAIAWVVAPSVIGWLYPQFSSEQVAATTELTRIVLPAQFAFVVGAMFVAVQYAKGVFTIPTLAPIIYNLAIIVGGIVFAVVTGEASPEGFVWGALIGAFLGNLLLQYWGARRVGMRIPSGVSWLHPAVKQYILIAIPLMLGQSIVALDETFMSVFGDFSGDGAQTQLLFARRTMLVPVGIIAQAAGVAAYPFLARLFAEGDTARMNRTVDRALKYVIVLSIGAAGLLTALSLPVIRTLFERREFTEVDSVAAASALFFYAFAIPVWGGLQILTRAFYAKRDMWTPVLVGTVATIVAIPIYFAAQDAFGIQGVALASVLTLGGYTAVLAGIWYAGRLGRKRMLSVIDSAGRSIPLVVAGSFGAFLVGWVISTNVPGTTTVTNLLASLAGGLTFAVIAVTLGALLYDWLARPVKSPPDSSGDEKPHDVMEMLS